jgi:sporulation-control protein spo0M
MTAPSGLMVMMAAALLTAACGGNTTTSQTSAASPSTVNPSQMSNQQSPPQQLGIDVTIKGGQVTPTNAQLQAKVNEPIVVRVDSDVADELHVHSVPDHTFNIEPKAGQSFQFTVTVPGQVEVELHHLDKTIATIQVQQ